MKIILLNDIPKVGKRYDVKEASDGYALNMLIPKGLAIVATSEALKRMELERTKHEGERKIQEELLQKNLSELADQTITITAKANDKGHLFASIHSREIVETIEKQTRLQISTESVILDKPIKEIGLHSIEVRTSNKKIKFNLDIVALK